MKDYSRYGDLWSRDEVILAFDLYCRIPFRKTKASTPAVKSLAAMLGRSPGSVARKLGNIGSLDPELRSRGIAGLGHASKVEKQVWNEFHSDWEALVLEAERLRLAFAVNSGRRSATMSVDTESFKNRDGVTTEAVRTRRIRIGQEFFRESVLSSYEACCCVTGINIPECLIASHILPWSDFEDARLNPANGLCLSATFDRLFDRGLMAVSADFTVLLANEVLNSNSIDTREFFGRFSGRPLHKPHRFLPREEDLAWHREHVFSG